MVSLWPTIAVAMNFYPTELAGMLLREDFRDLRSSSVYSITPLL
jgi:hypothetical protein